MIVRSDGERLLTLRKILEAKFITLYLQGINLLFLKKNETRNVSIRGDVGMFNFSDFGGNYHYSTIVGLDDVLIPS
jgi:hypothetical protein